MAAPQAANPILALKRCVIAPANRLPMGVEPEKISVYTLITLPLYSFEVLSCTVEFAFELKETKKKPVTARDNPVIR